MPTVFRSLNVTTLLSVVLTFIASPAPAMTLYKCTADDGSITYQDHRPEEGKCMVEQTELDLDANVIPSVEFAEEKKDGDTLDTGLSAEATDLPVNRDNPSIVESDSPPTAPESRVRKAATAAEIAAEAAEAAIDAAEAAETAAELADATGLEVDIQAAEAAAKAAEAAAERAAAAAETAENAKLAAQLADSLLGTLDTQ